MNTSKISAIIFMLAHHSLNDIIRKTGKETINGKFFVATSVDHLIIKYISNEICYFLIRNLLNFSYCLCCCQLAQIEHYVPV